MGPRRLRAPFYRAEIPLKRKGTGQILKTSNCTGWTAVCSTDCSPSCTIYRLCTSSPIYILQNIKIVMQLKQLGITVNYSQLFCKICIISLHHSGHVVEDCEHSKAFINRYQYILEDTD